MRERRATLAVAQVGAGDLGGLVLVRPSRQRRAERKQWVVQDDELTVAGQADIGLERLDPAGERRVERLDGGVRAVGAAESVRNQKRRADTRMGAGKTRRGVTELSPGRDHPVTTPAATAYPSAVSRAMIRGCPAIVGSSSTSTERKPACSARPVSPSRVKPQ